MKAKGAFLFVGGGVDKETAKSVVETKYLDLYVAGCKNYDEAGGNWPAHWWPTAAA